MRDILNDLEAGQHLSDPDPVRRAQIQMKAPRPKRFYKTVSVEPERRALPSSWTASAVQTPRAAAWSCRPAAAALVADEFAAQGETIDPLTMPVYRLVNTAIDGVASDPQAVLEDILRFSSSDLLCYRADAPQRWWSARTRPGTRCSTGRARRSARACSLPKASCMSSSRARRSPRSAFICASAPSRSGWPRCI